MTVEVGNWLRTGKVGFEVRGGIGEKWAELGGVRGRMGEPTSAETGDGVGAWQAFQNGSIIWHPKTGAHQLGSGILERYYELGGPAWGYPITDETNIAKQGRVVHFRQPLTGNEMSIYWTAANGPIEVAGPIRAVWVAAGFESGQLGLPLSREESWPAGGPDGTQQRFTGGRVAADPRRGVSPDPLTFLRPLSEGSLKGWVSTQIFWDGRVHNDGELSNVDVESHDFDVHIQVTNGTFGIAAHWHDHVAGSLERGRGTARWSQRAQLPEVAANFWTLQHAEYRVGRRQEATSAGPRYLDGGLRGSWRDGADAGLPFRTTDLRQAN